MTNYIYAKSPTQNLRLFCSCNYRLANMALRVLPLEKLVSEGSRSSNKVKAGMDPKEKHVKKRKENPTSDATEGAVKPIDGEEKEEKEIVELARKK